MYAFLNCFTFILLFPIVSCCTEGAGCWAGVLGSHRNRCYWVCTLWFGQEGKNAQNTHFGHFILVSRRAEGSGCWGRVLGSCTTRCLRPYLWCCTHEVKFAKNACFGRFDFVSPFPVVSRCAEGAGCWGMVLGSCRTRHFGVYMLCCGREVVAAESALFGRLALVSLFPIVL